MRAASSSSTRSSSIAATDFGLDEQRILGDGVVTGHGTIDGRLVFVFSQDFTVFGGSLSEAHAEKICKVMDLAMKVGAPIIGLNDSGGARIQEGRRVPRRLRRHLPAQHAGVRRRARRSRSILGPCAGGAVYSPAITDFTIMVEGTSYMFVTGPDVVRAVTHEDVDREHLGGASVHTTISGVAHLAAPDEASALALGAPTPVATCRRTTSTTRRASRPTDPVDRRDAALDERRPRRSRASRTTCTRSSTAIVDDGDFLELQPGWAANIIVGFARLDGRSVGIVAQQPAVLAGALDIDASDKAARFVRTCDAFNVPLLTLVDVPGFLPGCHPGARRHHPPRREAALRLLRGDGAQGDGHHAQGVRRRLRRHELEAHPRRRQPRLADGAHRGHGRRGRGEHHLPRRDRSGGRPRCRARASWPREYEERFANPYIAAGRGYVDDVIVPSETRPRVIAAFAMLEGKRDANPSRKHGNIPL